MVTFLPKSAQKWPNFAKHIFYDFSWLKWPILHILAKFQGSNIKDEKFLVKIGKNGIWKKKQDFFFYHFGHKFLNQLMKSLAVGFLH